MPPQASIVPSIQKFYAQYKFKMKHITEDIKNG